MTETVEAWIDRVSRLGLLGQALVLSGALGACLIVIAPLSRWAFGELGLVTAAMAALLCWFAGLLALIVTRMVAPPDQVTVHVISGMMIRMGIPLGGCLLIETVRPEWIAAGFAICLIPAFLVSLATETVLTVGRIAAVQAKAATNPASGTP